MNGKNSYFGLKLSDQVLWKGKSNRKFSILVFSIARYIILSFCLIYFLIQLELILGTKNVIPSLLYLTLIILFILEFYLSFRNYSKVKNSTYIITPSQIIISNPKSREVLSFKIDDLIKFKVFKEFGYWTFIFFFNQEDKEEFSKFEQILDYTELIKVLKSLRNLKGNCIVKKKKEKGVEFEVIDELYNKNKLNL